MSEPTSPQTPLRILHLVSSERWTGVAEPVVSLAQHQEELGNDVWLGCIAGKSLESQARLHGLKVMTDIQLNRRAILSHFHDFRAIRRFIREKGIDVIHAHLLNDHWVAAFSLLKLANPPLLVRTFHRYQTPRNDRWHRWLFCDRTDISITTSDDLKQKIESKLSLENGALQVALGAVNIDRFSPEIDGSKVRRELDIPDSAPVAGNIARMSPGRGHLWLLDSLPQVYKAVPNAKCVISGRGALKYTVRGRSNSGSHIGRTRMAGYRHNDLPETYASFDVALFLGQGSEGSCRGALEAMATGLPLIGLNNGAVPHYIEHGVNGYLVEPENREQLAEVMIDLLSDLPKAREMGRKARQTIEQKFLEIKRAERVMEIYRIAGNHRK